MCDCGAYTPQSDPLGAGLETLDDDREHVDREVDDELPIHRILLLNVDFPPLRKGLMTDLMQDA